MLDSSGHRTLSKRFGCRLRGTNAVLKLAAERPQGPADDERSEAVATINLRRDDCSRRLGAPGSDATRCQQPQGALQRHVETLTRALLESHRASSGLLGVNVTEANLREEPADAAAPLRERNSLEISTRVEGTKHVQVGPEGRTPGRLTTQAQLKPRRSLSHPLFRDGVENQLLPLDTLALLTNRSKRSDSRC